MKTKVLVIDNFENNARETLTRAIEGRESFANERNVPLLNVARPERSEGQHEATASASLPVPLLRQEQPVTRAFRTIWNGINGIVFAKSAGKARYVTYLSARDAGYYSIKIQEITARREKEFDGAMIAYYNTIKKDFDKKSAEVNVCYGEAFLIRV